jgi:hypothetical protein
MRKSETIAGRFICIMLLALLALTGCATAPVPVDTRPHVKVYSYPYYTDFPVESNDFERIWKTVLDVVSENWTIDVMDKESGYIQTTRIGYPDNYRDNVYTIKIFPDRKLVKIGITVLYRNSSNQALPCIIYTGGHLDDVGRQIQDRLRVIK